MTTPQIKARDLNPYLIRWDNLPGIEAMVTDRSSTDPKTQTVNTRIALLKIWCPPLLNPDYLALQKHVTGQMPLSTDKFIEHLDHLNLLSLSAGKIADLVKARFWELGGRQTPEGRDWVRDSIPELAHRETLRKSLYSVCTHLCPADYLLELLEDKAEVSSEEIIRSLKLLGEPFAARVFSYMYHNHSPKEPPVPGLWQDFHIGKVKYRELLKTAIIEATSPPAAGAGTAPKAGAGAGAGGPPPSSHSTSVISSPLIGMKNERGNDCYIVAAWTLLLNVPRLRNQIIKNLSASERDLRELAISHLNPRDSSPRTGSARIRDAVDRIAKIPSGSRQGDAGEVILHLASTLPPAYAKAIYPSTSLLQYLRSGAINQKIELLPIRIEPRTGEAISFEIALSQKLGEHLNPAFSSTVTKDVTQFSGAAPFDLFVSVNRARASDPITLPDTYRLPKAFSNPHSKNDSPYTLQAFVHWTGGHYLSFYKQEDGSWIMVNDSRATKPDEATLTYHRDRASLIYYQHDDAPSLNTPADNAWWKS